MKKALDSSTERSYINNLKGLLIILVVIGHFGQTVAGHTPGVIGNIFKVIMLLIYSFHMPLFVFVSGYLSKNVEKRRNKCFKDLMIPYLIFQVICGIGFFVVNKSTDVFTNIMIPQMGAWYLLALLGYRLLLPDLVKIRHIIVITVLLNIFQCCFTRIDNTFAFSKALGFLPFFLIGYYTDLNVLCAIRKKLKSITALCVLTTGGVLSSVLFVENTQRYQLLFDVLSRSARITDFDRWYDGIIANIIAFLICAIFSVAIVAYIPVKNKVVEKIGEDTMPLYLSHLIVFMGVSVILNKSNWIAVIIVSSVSAVLSTLVFSSKQYRLLFNKAMDTFKKLCFK